MDAIKKKMQAMKIEKDNAMDRADQCEQAAKAAKVTKNYGKKLKTPEFYLLDLKFLTIMNNEMEEKNMYFT